MTQTLRCTFIFILLFTFQQTFSQLVPNSRETKTTDADSVFSKVEVEASFPGGDAAWNKYVSNALKDVVDNFKKSDQGTCRVRFIVDKKGNISNVEAMNMKKTRLAKLVVEIIQNGPRWKPAQQDGRFVNAYREQPVTFTIQYEK